MPKRTRTPDNVVRIDLSELGKKVQHTFNKAGYAIEVAAESECVGDSLPAIGVAIDNLLETVKTLAEMQGLIGYEGAGEVQRLRESVGEKEADSPRQLFHPRSGGVVVAPFDGNIH
jgi:hypothetical protein